MAVYADVWGVAVRITDERLGHIVRRSEMVGQESLIEFTLSLPEVVVQSPRDDDVRLYHRRVVDSPVGDKFLCVVIRWHPEDAFLLTAFFTSKPKKGQVLWPKNAI